MKMERLSRILEEVGLRDGITNLRLNNEGTAALQLSGGRKLCFEYQEDEDLIFLYMPVIDLASKSVDRSALIEAMLSLNFLKLGAGRGELSIDRDTEQAICQIAFTSTSLDADKLDEEIDNFLKQRVECRHVLEKTKPSKSDVPSASQNNSRFQLLHRMGKR